MWIIKGCGSHLHNRFLISMLLISSSFTVINQPHISCHLFFVLCYTYALIVDRQIKFSEIPLKAVWILYLICFLAIAVNGQSSTTLQMLIKAIRTFLGTYFVLLLGYFSSSKFKIQDNLLRIIIAVTIYGFFTLVIKNDPLRLFLSGGFDVDYMYGGRLRVASTWSHPISYGFVCSILFITLLGLYKNGSLYKITGILLLFSSMLAGSRTVILTMSVMLVLYAVLQGSIGVKRNMLFGLMGVLIMSLFIPSLQKMLFATFDIFNGGTQISGSSIEMRNGQLEACLALFFQHPWYGGGFDYIQEGLGYGANMDWQYWQEFGELYGFESYLYVLLLERGIVGIIADSVMLLCIFLWLRRYKNNDNNSYTKAMAILVGFIIFAIMTGTLDTWIPSMFLIGVYMGNLRRNVTSKANSKPDIV